MIIREVGCQLLHQWYIHKLIRPLLLVKYSDTPRQRQMYSGIYVNLGGNNVVVTHMCAQAGPAWRSPQQMKTRSTYSAAFPWQSSSPTFESLPLIADTVE